jgi:hypothetical protein
LSSISPADKYINKNKALGGEGLLNYGLSLYFAFIILIIVAIILKKKPILLSAVGLLAVGTGESRSLFQGIESAFRALLATATDFLPIILLIGLVVAMTNMLKETGIDTVLSKPFLRLRRAWLIYWIFGLTLWVLALFLWPTPAVTLLGAVVLPTLGSTRLNPLGLAVGLCIFGEGMGLSGDYIIQGAPGLLAKSAGIGVEQVIEASIPLVLGSGLVTSLFGFWQFKRLNQNLPETGKGEAVLINHKEDMEPARANQRQSITAPGEEQADSRKRKFLALAIGFIFLFAVVWLLHEGLRGDGATAVTGGITILAIILGTLAWNYKTALNSFVRYIQEGMRFSMEVFAPIVVIAGFFLLGTQAGSENILLRSGPGYLEQLAVILSQMIPLNAFSCSLIIILAAALGAMSGSGFSALPFVGGIAAALGKTAGLPVIQLAVLGQVAAIWTDSTIIPWGFPAVVSAVTGTDAGNIVRHNVLPWLAALGWVLVWTLLHIGL